jgi:hypothetical protein
LNFLYLGLAIAGTLRVVRMSSGRASRRDGSRQRAGVAWASGGATAAALLVTFILVRTAFLTQVETPEPRYVLECFPALLALGAMCWLGMPSSAVPDGS